ncbi:uncharacterized protein LOC113494053 [Trichoplusia ni]|uniref:Uncharacterized protein LOC113494053 n=1 Tax=Trichoplusia ni TaxID=7111 RepID=A0A7E5VI45_TRINI|nr:uncharacterized protein LOC113494053 [Trichoplusia ni]
MGNSKRKRRNSRDTSTSYSDSSCSSETNTRRSRQRKRRRHGHKRSKRRSRKETRSDRRGQKYSEINSNREGTKTPPITSAVQLDMSNTPVIINNQSNTDLPSTNNTTFDIPQVNNASSSSVPLSFPNFWAQNNFPVAFSVVPEFDPSDNSQTIENWINKVNECAQIYSWNDRQICHYALPKLSGLAKKWYKGLPSVLYTWDEWIQKLKLAFPSNENYGDLLSTMLRFRCRFGQSLEHYYYDKMALINKCEITGTKAVGCLIHGIDDKFVRMGAGACMFNEPEQVLNYLRTVSQNENNSFTNRSRIRTNTQSRQSNIPNNEQTKNSSTDTLRCFNCNEPGHISLRCNKPIKRCNFCFKLGHDTKDCRKRNNTNDESTKVSSDREQNKAVMCITNNDTDNEKYYKDITVNDITLRGYIDLGSKCTLMRRSSAELICNEWDTKNLPTLQGFGNSAVEPLGRITVMLGIGTVKAETEVLVVSDQYLRTAILVGQSFTEKPNVILLKTESELLFITTPDLSDNDSKVTLCADKDEIVLPKMTMPVNVIANDKYTGGLSLNRKTMKDKYPMPRIEDQLDRLGGNKYFTSLDLFSGYYQVPMSENTKPLTILTKKNASWHFDEAQVNAFKELKARLTTRPVLALYDPQGQATCFETLETRMAGAGKSYESDLITIYTKDFACTLPFATVCGGQATCFITFNTRKPEEYRRKAQKPIDIVHIHNYAARRHGATAAGSGQDTCSEILDTRVSEDNRIRTLIANAI